MSNLILSDRESFELELDYWKGKLKGVAPLHLFTDFTNQVIQNTNIAGIEFFIDEKTHKQLTLLSEDQHVPLFTALLSAFKVLLFRYSGLEDICVGNIIPDLEKVGEFTNIVALRTELNTEDRFIELLQRINVTIIEVYKHQGVPFEKVADIVIKENDLGWNPLLQVMFIFQGQSEIINSDPQYTSKSDLVFRLKEKDSGLQGIIEYNSDLYNEEMVNRMITHYDHLLQSIIITPDKSIGALPMLTKDEEHVLLEELNDTTVGYPDKKTVLDLFEEQVEKTPDNVAVAFGEKVVTYKELNILSNQLGDYLRKNYKIKPDDLIALKLERSEWIIVAMLGVLKSGGAYVPIDPDYPEERTSYIVKDSGSKALIDEAELEKFIYIKNTYNPENQATGLQPHHLIYCIYTSGSTGQPKGVLLEHYNVVRLLYTDKPLFDFSEHDVWTMFHSYNFDFSVWEMYGAILFGGKVVVVPKAIAQDSDAFLNLLQKESVTILNQTPSSFYNLIDADSRNNTANLNLRYVIFGGEALQPARLANWKNKYNDTMLINMYGITETTVHVTYKVIGLEEITNGASNIGRPIPTLSCYIMNEYLQLVPIGTVGELFVGGAGLARGYLNRPELTAEKFIDNPYRPGERIYRSGDLGKLLADGNLEYLGRIDDQVKIRGFRIELGEIASALLKHDKISAAVVIAKAINGPEKELIAYTTGGAEGTELRDFLKEKLPSYMVPGYYVQLESIPLTNNGKVNKKALPMPVSSGIDEAEYLAPSTDTEKDLLKIWSEVLGIPAEKISVKGNFFDMGGHSIKAIRLLGLIHKQLGVKLVLKELFTGNTIEQQALAITQKEQNKYRPVQIVEEQPDYGVSSAQKRLWVLNHFEGAQNTYNIPSIIMLDGSLDKEALKKTFQSLIARHEILRTVFKEDKDGNPRQKVLSSAEYAFTLRETDLRDSADQEKQLKQQLVNLDISGSFDLSEGPLLRCHLIQLDENKYVLVMVQHHIISDGWSMDIFRRDLCSLYNGFVLGKDPKLPILGIQYKDYAAWHTKQLETDNILPHKEYWLKQFKDEIPVLELPADKERPNIKSYNGCGLTVTIDNNILSGLNKIAKANGGTLFMSLLSCVNTLLHRYTSQEDIVIGSPIAGREHPDLEDQIGFYINTLALRTRFDGTGSFEDLFHHIKEVTLNAYEHQLYPYDELVDALKLPRNMNRNPLFDVMVVLQNSMEHDTEFTLNGLQAQNYETGDYRIAKFDINFMFSETKSGLNLFLEYNTDIYSSGQMEYMLTHLENIIASIIQDPKQRLSDINFLTSKEKRSLLYDFNDTLVDYPSKKNITDLFEEQVLKTPDTIALRQHELTMSYRELNERSNQLARYLISQGVKKQDNIGLLASRGFDMIIGMYAIMKAGGAYVPIDPDYPLERQEYILKNSAAVKVISDGNYPLEQFLTEGQFIKMNTLDLNGYENNNLGLAIDSKQLAYTIYTSGSTGRPKGVMIEHHSAVNLILWVNTEFQMGPNDRVLFITSMCFDLSVYDIFGLLAAGGSVVIVEQHELMDVPKLKDMLLKYEITYWDSVPSTMDYLVRELESADNGYLQKSLRVVFMSGDWIPVDLPTRIKKYFPETRVISLGGATEGTVWSNFFPVEKVESNWKSIPYGRPMNNNFFYILDKQLNPVPRGVVGELYIGGVGVARGYANDKEKTDYAFVNDPFNSKAGGRMYRTGDLGRMLPSMNMEFIGRKDDQVKIRGYRIELGEIETVIRQCEFVSQAIVLARADKEGKKRLVSYVVGKGQYTRDAVLSYIKGKLPDYMVPTLWLELDALPLTSNGKIDKKALPDFDFEEQLKDKYIAPATESEKLLAGIWQEVLKLKDIGVEDNFFDIGGHSLLAVQIITRIESRTGKKFPITILFEHPTIKSLNAFMQKDNVEKIWKSLVPIKPTGNKTPLYIVHGVGLNVLNFSSLALYVDKEQPIYGLQARGIDGVEVPLDNIQDIAKHYVNEVIEHNPVGPYAIAGYSLGGIIVVEMARQLEEMNKKVSMLAAIDTDADETNKEKWYVILPKKLKRYSPKFLGGTKSFSKQLMSILEQQLISTLKKVGLSKETAETKAYYALLDNISDKLIHAYENYELLPFNGTVHIFNAEICEHYTDDTEYLGWQKFALKGVNRYVVPGSHLSMLQSPNVDKFGAILQEVLDNLK